MGGNYTRTVASSRTHFRAPRRSRLIGAIRFLRMKWGHFVRRSPHPAPVGRPDFYRRELDSVFFVRSISGLTERELIAPNHTEPNIYDVARRCYEKYRVFPLNFSFPRPELIPQEISPRPYFLSSTIPGEPFSFEDWESYLDEYRQSYFALSTRKGGWDTFRHLEILFSGAIPLMPRLARTSPFSLAHFPKRALVRVLSGMAREGLAIPGEKTRAFFHDFSTTRLTSVASAEYLRSVAKIPDGNILFLDRSLPGNVDYLSAFTLIGLLQSGSGDVKVAYEPSYLFDDFQGDTKTLYGRGFGYSRSLPSRVRPAGALSLDAPLGELQELCEDARSIVVGSYDNNREVVQELVRRGIPEERFVCVVGSDLATDFSLRHHIKSSPMTFFVREFA